MRLVVTAVGSLTMAATVGVAVVESIESARADPAARAREAARAAVIRRVQSACLFVVSIRSS